MYPVIVTGTGLVKSRDRFRKLILAYPDRADMYRERLAKIEDQIVVLQVCRRCGRPLKDEGARAIGYGKECQSKAEAAEEK